MPRLFVGTFLSEEGIERLTKLSQDNADLAQAWRAKIRWTHRDKLHITWVFLGEVDESAIPNVISDLRKAIGSISPPSRPLSLVYDRIELWPNEREARLAVLTPRATPDAVFKLDDKIKDAVTKYISPDQQQHELKTFRPHITLLRFPDGQKRSSAGKSTAQSTDNGPFFRKHSAKVSDFIVESSILPITHEINEVHLIQSTFGGNTHEYTRLATIPLS